MQINFKVSLDIHPTPIWNVFEDNVDNVSTIFTNPRSIDKVSNNLASIVQSTYQSDIFSVHGRVAQRIVVAR